MLLLLLHAPPTNFRWQRINTKNCCGNGHGRRNHDRYQFYHLALCAVCYVSNDGTLDLIWYQISVIRTKSCNNWIFIFEFLNFEDLDSIQGTGTRNFSILTIPDFGFYWMLLTRSPSLGNWFRSMTTQLSKFEEVIVPVSVESGYLSVVTHKSALSKRWWLVDYDTCRAGRIINDSIDSLDNLY